jgi:putative membrane protein
MRDPSTFFNVILGLHIVAVIAWMAGILYLPRLFVYHTRAKPGSEMDETFQEMEVKLLRIIMTPAMVVVFLLGGTLVWLEPGVLHTPWMWTKLAGVLALAGWHGFLARSRREFAEGRHQRTERFWRMSNELPFLVAILIVLSVTTKWML